MTHYVTHSRAEMWKRSLHGTDGPERTLSPLLSGRGWGWGQMVNGQQSLDLQSPLLYLALGRCRHTSPPVSPLQFLSFLPGSPSNPAGHMKWRVRIQVTLVGIESRISSGRWILIQNENKVLSLSQKCWPTVGQAVL
jgi:hypothetical protein